MYENLAGRDCVMEEEQDSDAVDLGHTCISFTMAVQGLQGRHTWGYRKRFAPYERLLRNAQLSP